MENLPFLGNVWKKAYWGRDLIIATDLAAKKSRQNHVNAQPRPDLSAPPRGKIPMPEK